MLNSWQISHGLYKLFILDFPALIEFRHAKDDKDFVPGLEAIGLPPFMYALGFGHDNLTKYNEL